MNDIVYGPGGYGPGRPFNNVLRWPDDTKRLVYEYSSGDEVVRPYTAEENAQADARASALVADMNRRAMHDQARAALIANRDFLALTAPTNAQTLAHVKTMTRELNALIRLVLGDLESTG